MSDTRIHFLLATGVGIRPIELGINHIIRNIKSEEELDRIKEYAKTAEFSGCDDWEEFRTVLISKQKTKINKETD